METINGVRPRNLAEIDPIQPRTEAKIQWSLAGQQARLIEGIITPPRFWGEEHLSQEDLLQARLGCGRKSMNVVSEPKIESVVTTPLVVPEKYHPK